MSWFAALRANVWGLLAAAGAVLVGLLTHYRSKSERATERAEKAETVIQYRDRVDEADTEIRQEYSDLRREAQADIRKGEVPKSLRDPNSNW